MNKKQHDFLENIFREKNQPLFSYALRSLKNPQIAEDVVMQTFSVAVKNVDKLMKSPNPEGWLMKTLIHKILHERQNLARRPVIIPIDDVEGMEDITLDVPESIPAMSCLTSDEKKLVEKFYGEEKSISEIAQELNITVSACKKRLQRIRDKVKNNYDK